MQASSRNSVSHNSADERPRATPPWRRQRVGANEATAAGAKCKHLPELTVPAQRELLEDDRSTAAASSDTENEEVSSPRSISSSNCDEGVTLDRNLLLMHRPRCMNASAEPGRRAGLDCRPIQASSVRRLAAPAPSAPVGFVPPPGLELQSGAKLVMPSYAPSAFRKEFMAILKDLAVDRNVARAVRRVRSQGVPVTRQAAEFADAITFVLEEPRGAARRSFVALLAGLAFGVFDKKQCILGLEVFFRDVYPDLQEEVPKLSKLVNVELMPTLRSVFFEDDLESFVAMAKLAHA